ncbi:hypothetical protein [Paludibacterium denitrificans]|uniref:hypothetical protein n=1 Tax=Paludibacterium denitrificans TaxID=2675226 RepID=UPI001E5F4267|nr:hypothetical protein [Paludibacterium denitrificans]
MKKPAAAGCRVVSLTDLALAPRGAIDQIHQALVRYTGMFGQANFAGDTVGITTGATTHLLAQAIQRAGIQFRVAKALVV